MSDLDMMRDMIEAIFDQKMMEHEQRDRELLERRLQQLKDEAFPDGEAVPHRDYHQAKIDAAEAQKLAAEAQRRFWESARSKILEKGIDGAISVIKVVAILGVLWAAVKLSIPIPDWLVR